MNRRAFLGTLGAMITGATLDPERALWIPGRKLISIPPSSGRLCKRLIIPQELKRLLDESERINERIRNYMRAAGGGIASSASNL